MLSEVLDLSASDIIPKRLLNVVSTYVGFLSLVMKRHMFLTAGELSGLDQSRFCALMNNPKTKRLSHKLLNRTLRRRLEKIQRIEKRLIFIIDATIVGRRGKKIENVGCYHNGQRHIWGHKYINCVVLSGVDVIPLESIPIYTKAYALQMGFEHVTEPQLVAQWIKNLSITDLFEKEALRSAIFLLDSGYDAKCIQNTIRDMGWTFVMAVRTSRIINGKRVIKLFKDTQRFKSKTIRLTLGSGGKGLRRSYSVQEAWDVKMKGFGSVTMISSKLKDRKGCPRKYIVSNDLKMRARDVVRWYAMRWRIEMWHREMKQKFGFIDCKCRKTAALESHINFSLTAYLLQKESGQRQLHIEEFVRREELMTIKHELTKYGAIPRLKTYVHAALQSLSA